MDSEKLEQLFLLEVLIDNVCLKDTSIGTVEEPLRVRVKFIDFPCFEINQQDFTKGDVCPASPGNFNSGKSCLFPMIPVDLIRNLQRYPLAVTVYQVKQDGALPNIVGQTRVRMTDGMLEAVQTAMNCSCDTDLPITYTLKDTFSLINVGGDVGTVVLFVRLSCFGQSIVTQFQMMGEKKAFLFKNSKDDKAYSCKKPVKETEDPNRYDALLAKPFITGEDTTFDCGCDDEDLEGKSVAWKLPAPKPVCPSPCALAEPICPDDCTCPCEALPELCNHKQKKQPAMEPSMSGDSCVCGFEDGDVLLQQGPPPAPMWYDMPGAIGSLTSSCRCEDDDGDGSSASRSAGSNESPRPFCGEGDGATCGYNAEGVTGEEKQTRSTSYRNSDIPGLPNIASGVSSQGGKKVSVSIMSEQPGRGGKTKKRKRNFTHKWGMQYPGIKSGHRNCVEPVCMVPSDMGWMWKAKNNNACPGISKPRKGWKPGAVGFTISKMINEHRIAAGKSPNNIAPKKRGFRGGRRVNADGGEDAPQPPTLHIHRKDGAYYISMHPLDIGGDSDQVPLEFKIPKQQGCDGASESDESEIEIEFMAPGAFELKKEPPVFRSFGTQYLNKDVAQSTDGVTAANSLQLHKDKKAPSGNEEKKPAKEGKKGGKKEKKKDAAGATSGVDIKAVKTWDEDKPTAVGILNAQKKKK